MKGFVKFRSHPNVLVMQDLSSFRNVMPMKLQIRNPFTNEVTLAFFKKMIKSNLAAIYVEGNKEGSIRGG